MSDQSPEYRNVTTPEGTVRVEVVQPGEIGEAWSLAIPALAQRTLWLPRRTLDTDFLSSLAPADTGGYGTGLLVPPSGIIAPSALTVARIRAQMEVGTPDQADNSLFCEGTYNQLATPRCASYSACGILSALKRKQHGPGNYWRFDADRLFQEGGGTDQGGVMQAMDSVLDNLGGLRVDDQRRYKEMSWAQVPNVAGVWEEAVCAAISAGGFVHQATLVWQGFGSQPNGALTSGYHAVFLAAYRKTPKLQFRFKNSWGDQFGQQGFAWADAEAFTQQGFQHNYAYSLTLIDATDVGIIPIPTPTPGGFVQQILDLTNQARSAAGLGSLKLQSQLMSSAQGYAVQLAAGIPFSHTGPDGSTPFSRMHAADYQGPIMGENIARGFATAQDVFTAWMNSPGHRQNILFPQYRQIGIGVAGDSWVQDFGAGGSDDGGPPPPPPPPPSPSDPTIAGVWPNPALPGGPLSIIGQHFGPMAGSVHFGSGATVTSWSDTEVMARLPADAQSGTLTLTTAAGRIATIQVNVNTTPPPPPPPPVTLALAVTASERAISGIPNRALVAGSVASVMVEEPGQFAVGGTATVGGNPPPPPPPPPGGPTISGTAPEPVARGGLLTIRGSGFGGARNRVVFYPGAVGRVNLWSDGMVQVFVPQTAGAGANQIELDRADGAKTNAIITVS